MNIRKNIPNIIMFILMCVCGLAYGIVAANAERESAPILRDCGIDPATGHWGCPK